MVDEASRKSRRKSCILWQNGDQTVTLLDVPHSIELVQQFEYLGERKLLSSHPLEKPYSSFEPKSKKALAAVKRPDIDDLILQRVLSLALEEAAKGISDDEGSQDGWCLQRSYCHEAQPSPKDESQMKRQRINALSSQEHCDTYSSSPLFSKSAQNCYCNSCPDYGSKFPTSSPSPFLHNFSHRTITLSHPITGPSTVPFNATYICGTITDTLPFFIQHAPQFSLIILDPPWPNRSVRRAGSYQTSYGTAEIRALLSSIPLWDKLAEGGLVGVWVTNKPAFRTLLLGGEGERGLFEEWGIEFVEEWVWLKITSKGEPVSPIGGTWRKPYEILLVGRKISRETDEPDMRDVICHEMKNHDNDQNVSETEEDAADCKARHDVGTKHLKRRVILAVPDIHSRKPNLTSLFTPLLSPSPSPSPCLEVFARNLTANSWAWGDEVMKFQSLEYWTKCMHTRLREVTRSEG